MTNTEKTGSNFSQLQAVLMTPLVDLEFDNHESTFLTVSAFLQSSGHCCVVVPVNSHKISGIISLYRHILTLRKLRRKCLSDYPLSCAVFIGAYPSLQNPASVYELDTDADSYVTENILPKDVSTLKSFIKYVIKKMFGVNPSVGGLGLLLSKELT